MLNAKCIKRGMEVKSKFTLCCCFVTNNCWTRSFTLGYWLFYFSSVLCWLRWGKKPKQVKDCFKWVCLLPFHPCLYWGQSIFVTVGSFIVSNHLIAESIMVRHMKFLLVFSFPLRVYCLMRSTPNALWGIIMTSLIVHDCPFGCVSCFWQDLQYLTLLDGMCIPFQYITDFDALLRREWLGCWR